MADDPRFAGMALAQLRELFRALAADGPPPPEDAEFVQALAHAIHAKERDEP